MKADKNLSKKHGDFSKFIKKDTPKKEKSSKDESKKRKKPILKKNKFTKKLSENVKRNEADRNKDNLFRLNKFIANSGICSRREADKLIEAGVIKVNGKIITELGTKVSRDDVVKYGDTVIVPEKLNYILLNKPKGFISTMDDPFERKTVMSLVSNACKERIYPVGRLDLNTTGLLLFTNDGELAKRLTHPKYGVKKLYHVTLDKPLTYPDFEKIANGIELDDGMIKVDKIAYVEHGNDKKQLGIEIHSGRNRIVRRIFESINYKVLRLDRVIFAGLTKKDIPRGKWRQLKEHEVNVLKRFSV
ncbi:MAG: rRNA pseudouridine synthase [Bacteroidales bacterium]|nr:rRNA pseudouridine synthase [Bacteroidales bacterium]